MLNQTGGVTALYRHGGQMGIEDVETQGSNVTVTRYGLGARGVDLIERTNSGGTVTAFPIYDAHGNNVASLTRSGTGFQIGDRRTYDAWGQVRAQQSGGDPKLRYCASLGHRADDESGLIYMRARYYEPSSGRFVSEDPAMQGTNWFTYAKNQPITLADRSGLGPEGINELIGELSKCLDEEDEYDAADMLDSKVQQITDRLAMLSDEADQAERTYDAIVVANERDHSSFDPSEIAAKAEALADSKAAASGLAGVYKALKADFMDVLRDVTEMLEDKWM